MASAPRGRAGRLAGGGRRKAAVFRTVSRSSPSAAARVSKRARSKAANGPAPRCRPWKLESYSAPPCICRIKLSTCSARSGIVLAQPLDEQRLELVRQAQQHVARACARPRSAACSRMRSSSWSLSAGMIGAAITPVGTPLLRELADHVRVVASGPAVRGSMLALELVVERRDAHLTATRLSARRARASKSRSRRISPPFVMIVSGCLSSSSTSRMPRVDQQLALERLIRIGVAADVRSGSPRSAARRARRAAARRRSACRRSGSRSRGPARDRDRSASARA